MRIDQIDGKIVSFATSDGSIFNLHMLGAGSVYHGDLSNLNECGCVIPDNRFIHLLS